MKHRFDDIELAYEFVSFRPPMENRAVLCRETGAIYFLTEEGDLDEDAPEAAIEGGPGYVDLPHQQDLDLGSRLVHRFTAEHAPQLADEVRRIFSSRGAYGRFKDLLDRDGLLQAWYDYERVETETALRQWCADHDVDVTDVNDGP